MIDQNQDRKKFVGGSEVAAIMGLNRWDTPLGVWAKKTGIGKEFEGNEATELGTDLEPFVCQKFEQKSGLAVEIDNTHYTHPDYPYMVGHIDRRVVNGGILEAKTCSAWKANEWEGQDIPQEYIVQLNFYLGLTGEKQGYMAVLIGGQKFRWKELEFDQDLFDLQVSTVKDFWENYVLTNTPPMAIANDHDTLLEMFPESRPDTLIALRGDDPELEAEFNQLTLDRIEAKNQIKEIEAELDATESRLKQLIGENEGIESGQFKASWKGQQSKRVDINLLREDDLYDKYTKVNKTRVLRTTEKKGKENAS